MPENVEIDPETGEVVGYDHSDEASDPAELIPYTDPIVDQWGEEAQELLAAVTEGIHFRKKRRTLLKLAEATYINVAQATVFKMPDCASKVAHYKWRDVDPDYEAAYLYLVGDPHTPGIAKLTREAELDEDEALAVSALVQARTTLRLGSADAAATLMNALDASDRFGTPLWRERIVAANAVLGYTDNDTGAAAGPSVTLIDKAIMVAYPVSDGMPSSTPDGPTADDEAGVVEGEYTEEQTPADDSDMSIP